MVLFKEFLKDERGLSLTEYLVVVGSFVAAVVVGGSVFSGNLESRWDAVPGSGVWSAGVADVPDNLGSGGSSGGSGGGSSGGSSGGSGGGSSGGSDGGTSGGSDGGSSGGNGNGNGNGNGKGKNR